MSKARTMVAAAEQEMRIDRTRALCVQFDRASYLRTDSKSQEDEDWSAYCAACPARWNHSEELLPLRLLATGAMCIAATPRSFCKALCYFDNTASHNMTYDASMLDNVIRIDPFLIGSIAPGCIAIHLGELVVAFLPRPFSKCNFVPSMNINLISLGYIDRCGEIY